MAKSREGLFGQRKRERGVTWLRHRSLGGSLVATSSRVLPCWARLARWWAARRRPDDKEPVEPVATASPDEIYSGVCRGNCGGRLLPERACARWASVRTSARDMPNTQYNRICSKGLTHVGRMYGANRVLYPMKQRRRTRLQRLRAHQLGRGAFHHRREMAGLHRRVRFVGHHVLPGARQLRRPERVVQRRGSLSALRERARLLVLRLDVDAAVGFGSQRATGGIDLGND